MSKVTDFLSVAGLTIDAVGAIIIVLPDIPPFKRYLLWTEKLREIRSIRDEVANGGSFLRGDDDYKILMDVLSREAGTIERPYEVNVYIPNHPSDDGALRFVREQSSSSESNLRGSFATDGDQTYLTTTRVVTWLEREIEREQGQLRQHYQKVGVIVLAIGFTIQAIVRASSSLYYLIFALALSVTPFVFFHILIDQDLNKI